MKKKVCLISSFLLLLFSCSPDSTPPKSTSITTSLISDVNFTTVSSGADIASDGGQPITARGLVWSSAHNPTFDGMIGSFYVDGGKGSGTFSSQISNLELGSTYFVRAYAINSLGTFYGNELTFTTKTFSLGGGTDDFDGNKYNSIILDKQEWLQSNLNVSHYRNGDPIPEEEDDIKWQNLTTGAWCYAESKTENGIVYGKLYNWYAVNDSRGLAPLGWHIPTDKEWNTFSDLLGGDMNAGGRMKEKSNIHWILPNQAATNSSGFTGLPGGFRAQNYSSFVKLNSFWWGSTENNGGAFTLSLIYNTGYITKTSSFPKNYGLSVRCLKN